MKTFPLLSAGDHCARVVRAGLLAVSALACFASGGALAQMPPCASPGADMVAWWPAEGHTYNVVIHVTLNDHGLPPFTTNATVTVTVSPHGVPRLGIRPAGEDAFEFTLEDGAVGADYILQVASPWVDQASWVFQGTAVPGAYPLVEEADYLEHLSWEEFVAARLQRTVWTEATLGERAKGDPEKVKIAVRLRKETLATVAWMAERLRMGCVSNVNFLLYHWRLGQGRK